MPWSVPPALHRLAFPSGVAFVTSDSMTASYPASDRCAVLAFPVSPCLWAPGTGALCLFLPACGHSYTALDGRPALTSYVGSLQSSF